MALRKTFFVQPLPEGRLTIFIHGTKASWVSKMVHNIEFPLGVVPLAVNKTNSILARIGCHLIEADPVQFPRESFYYYGWSGQLAFIDRLRAAQQLYSVIKKHKGPITIITHSHGCNVALNLACAAKEKNDASFCIDKLIMLAPPVQEVTKPYAHSPVFKEIYTFYSSADLMQIGDAQALYWESYACTPPQTRIPFLSARTFDPAPNIFQTRVLLDWQSPGHLLFMLGRFIKRIPELMKLVKSTAEKDGFDYRKNCYIANIPLCNLPAHIVEPAELKHHYIPRSNYHKTKRLIKQNQCA